MQFLFPGVLWGLLALAVPIIIHLFHFRRYKQVYFTNVKFLKEVKEERSASRKLRNLLVLLTRLLAVALLVIGFAQPFIGDKDKSIDQKLVSVFVDNSFSMTSLSSDVPLIEKGKKRASDIVQSYQETDRFQVLTHDYSGMTSKILSQEEALEAIKTIEITPKVKSLNTILQKQKQTFEKQKGKRTFFMLSDFQKSITDLPIETDTTFALSLVPLKAVTQQNISIDSAYFTSPVALIGQRNSLLVKLTNYSDTKQDEVTLTVLQNGQKKPAGSFSIDANSSRTDTVNLTMLSEGKQDITLQIRDYPIQFDDQYYLSTLISNDNRVLAISDSGTNKYVKAVFDAIPAISLTQSNIKSLDYSTFSDYKLIILEDVANLSSGLSSELDGFIRKGGNVVCFPPQSASINSLNQFFDKLGVPRITQWETVDNTVFGINTDEFVFNKVYTKRRSNADLPKVTGQYRFANTSNKAGETLLSYRSGSAFVTKYLREEGHLYVCAAPLDRRYSELVEYAEVFVPMIYKMTFAQGSETPLAYQIGKTNTIKVPYASSNAESIVTLKGDQAEYIPQQTNQGATTELIVKDEITEAGFYTLNNGDKMIRSVAFNHNRLESDPAVFAYSELSEQYGDTYTIYDSQGASEFLAKLKEKEEGVFLWKWCLIFALIFLAVETLILRYWR